MFTGLNPAPRILRGILFHIEGLSLPRSRLLNTSSLTLRHTLEAAPAYIAASPKEEKWEWSALVLFIPGLATFGLGTWQLKRRQWKMELLEYRRNRLREDIVPLELALSSTPSQSLQDIADKQDAQKNVLQSLEYRRVQCEGIYAEDKSIFLGPRGRSTHGVTERGYFLVTPLLPVQEDGGRIAPAKPTTVASKALRDDKVPVLVNRGWVPGSWRNATSEYKSESNSRADDSPAKQKYTKVFPRFWWRRKHKVLEDSKPKVNTTKVVGVIRGSEKPNMFVPSNEPESGQWFYVDVPAMARAVNLPEDTIYIEALREEETFKVKEYPDPKDPDALIRSSVMPQDHLSYAFTWYTLAGATTFMAWKRLQKRV